MATLLDEIRELKEEYLHERKIQISINGKSIAFDVDITRIGESLYASCKELNISAGSQDDNHKLAEVKALMRLVNKIMRKIRTHKEYDALETISIDSISPNRLNAIIDFSQIFTMDRPKSKKFQIYREEIQELDKDQTIYEYGLINIGETDNPVEIQMENSIDTDSNRHINKLIVATSEDWYNFVGTAA